MEPHPTSPFLPFLYASKAPTSAVSFSQPRESMASVERSWLDLTTGSRETSGPVRHGRGEQGRQAQQGQPRAAMSPGSKHPQHAAKVGSLPPDDPSESSAPNGGWTLDPTHHPLAGTPESEKNQHCQRSLDEMDWQVRLFRLPPRLAATGSFPQRPLLSGFHAQT